MSSTSIITVLPVASLNPEFTPDSWNFLFRHMKVLSYSAEEFTQHVLAGHIVEARAKIDLIKRRKARGGLQHEFILMRATSEAVGEFWLRIDRAANSSALFSWRGSSSLPLAADTVQIAKTEAELVARSGESVEKSSVSFSAHLLDVRGVAHLLKIICAVSPKYNLIKENCYFLASMLQETFTDVFKGTLTSGEKPTWAREHGYQPRLEVFSRAHIEVPLRRVSELVLAIAAVVHEDPDIRALVAAAHEIAKETDTLDPDAPPPEKMVPAPEGSLLQFAQQLASITRTEAALRIWTKIESYITDHKTINTTQSQSYRLLLSFASYQSRRYANRSAGVTSMRLTTTRSLLKLNTSIFFPLPIVVLPVKKFCSRVMKGNFAEAHACVEVLIRQRMKISNHEFILVRARTGVAEAGNTTASANEKQNQMEIWMRIDRAAIRDVSLWSTRSMVMMAHSKLELNVDLRKSEEVASVSFSAEEGRGPQPRLRDLAHLLSIVEDISPKFKSLNQNGLFFSSIVQEGLTDMFDGTSTGDAPVYAEGDAAQAREDVLVRAYDEYKVL